MKLTYTHLECLICGKETKVGEQVYELIFGELKLSDDGCIDFERANSVGVHGYEHFSCRIKIPELKHGRRFSKLLKKASPKTNKCICDCSQCVYDECTKRDCICGKFSSKTRGSWAETMVKGGKK